MLGDVIGWHTAFVKFFIPPSVGEGSDDQAVVVIDTHQSDLSGVVDIA